MYIYQWAVKHNIPYDALHELLQEWGVVNREIPGDETAKLSETAVQANARLQMSRDGGRAWRNNVGVLPDKDGRPVRYGLANDSKKLNEVLKSSDLIGIKPVCIEPYMVGWVIGRFWARECKPEGWVYTGTDRERAQLAFINLINSLGGDAAFANGGE